MQKHRVFIGIEIPTKIKESLIKIQEKLAKNFSLCPLRLVPLKNLHITLYFLGYLNEDEIKKIKEILTKITKNTSPFNLSLENFCFFPNEKKFRVIAIQINDKENKLCDLQKELGKRLTKLNFIRLEKKEYLPHLTIARAKELRPSLEKIEKIKEIIIPQKEWKVLDIKLIKSILKKDGAEYIVLQNWKLTENKILKKI